MKEGKKLKKDNKDKKPKKDEKVKNEEDIVQEDVLQDMQDLQEADSEVVQAVELVEKKKKSKKKDHSTKREEGYDNEGNSVQEQHGSSKRALDDDEGDAVDFKGPPLTPEMVGYVRQLGEVLAKDEFEEEDEKRLLIDNLHEEIMHKEYRLCVNQRCSQIMERVLKVSTAAQLRSFFANLRHGFYLLFTDRSASHVLQVILERVPALLQQECKDQGRDSYLRSSSNNNSRSSREEDEEEQRAVAPSVKDCLLAMCEELKPSWIELSQSVHGSFLIRTILAIFAGQTHFASGDDKKKASNAKQPAPTTDTTYLQPFSDVLAALAAAVASQPHSDLLLMTRDPTAGPVLQALLQTLAFAGRKGHQRQDAEAEREARARCYFADKAAEFTAKLLKWGRLGENYVDGKDEGDMVVATQWVATKSSKKHVSSLLCDISGSHLVEVVLESCSDTVFEGVFQAHFRQQLLPLAEHRSANFCVQKLLAHLRTKEQVESCLEELEGSFGKLIAANRVGVIWRLAESCLRLKAEEKRLVAGLCKSLGIVVVDKADAGEETVAHAVAPSATSERTLAGKKNFVEALMTMGTSQDSQSKDAVAAKGGNDKDSWQRRKSRFSVLGSRLAQTLCAFPFHSIRTSFVEHFLRLGTPVLVDLATDTAGSILVEAFLQHNQGNSGVPFTYRQRLVDRFRGEYAKLSCGGGSFVVEKLFANAGIKRKKTIAKEMVESQKKMANSHTGRILLSKCKIDLFRKNEETWEQEMRAREKQVEFLRSMENNDNSAASNPQDDANKDKKKPKKRKRDEGADADLAV